MGRDAQILTAKAAMATDSVQIASKVRRLRGGRISLSTNTKIRNGAGAMTSQSVRVKRNLMLSTCAFAISAAVASSALAQSREVLAAAAPSAGGGATLETVIVTAERRGTDVQRTPDAVTPISSTTLDQSFTTSVAGL